MTSDLPWPYALAVGPKEIKDDLTGFLALVGRSIALWSHVESKVADIYLTCVGAHGIFVNPFHQPIVVSYYAVASLEARIAMTAKAVTEAMSTKPELAGEWPALSNRIDRKYRIRSNIAHASLYGNCHKGRGKQIWLQPNAPVFGVGKRGKDGKPIQYFAGDLETICGNFSALANQLGVFDSKISRAMSEPGFGVSIPGHHLRAHAKVVLKPKAPPRPPQSSEE
jgi:hypothetical protein